MNNMGRTYNTKYYRHQRKWGSIPYKKFTLNKLKEFLTTLCIDSTYIWDDSTKSWKHSNKNNTKEFLWELWNDLVEKERK